MRRGNGRKPEAGIGGSRYHPASGRRRGPRSLRPWHWLSFWSRRPLDGLVQQKAAIQQVGQSGFTSPQRWRTMNTLDTICMDRAKALFPKRETPVAGDKRACARGKWGAKAASAEGPPRSPLGVQTQNSDCALLMELRAIPLSFSLERRAQHGKVGLLHPQECLHQAVDTRLVSAAHHRIEFRRTDLPEYAEAILQPAARLGLRHC